MELHAWFGAILPTQQLGVAKASKFLVDARLLENAVGGVQPHGRNINARLVVFRQFRRQFPKRARSGRRSWNAQ